MGKKFVGLDGLKHFWSRAKTWILEQITAEVTAKIAELVANAPGDLDTLKEIADWISAHADSASAMNTQIQANTEAIAGKADKVHTHTKSDITDLGNILVDKQSIIDAVYPVGSLYWSSKSTNPASLFGGTWVQIKDRFVLACGDTYKTVGATGGASTVTLSVSNMPSHNHSFKPSGSVSSHSHGLNNHNHSFTPSGSISSSGQHYHYFEYRDDSASWSTTKSSTNVNAYHSSDSKYVNYNSTDIQKSAGDVIYYPNVSSTDRGIGVCFDTEGNGRANPVNKYLTNGFQGSTSWSGYHAHTFTGSAKTTDGASGNTASATPTFTGNAGTTGSNGSGTSFSILPPYVVKYCWERTA
jgi:hypothetical protein